MSKTPDMAYTPKNCVSLRIRVRYGECDAQQVVFNARYADYADLATTEYVRALVGKHQALLDKGYDNQVVSLSINWRASARFDDVIELRVYPSHIGNSSFTLTTDFYLQSDKELRNIASANVVYVMVDSNSYEKRRIPDFLRERFEDSFDVTVDQAG